MVGRDSDRRTSDQEDEEEDEQDEEEKVLDSIVNMVTRDVLTPESVRLGLFYQQPKRKAHTCGLCGQAGHNKKTCPQKKRGVHKGAVTNWIVPNVVVQRNDAKESPIAKRARLYEEAMEESQLAILVATATETKKSLAKEEKKIAEMKVELVTAEKELTRLQERIDSLKAEIALKAGLFERMKKRVEEAEEVTKTMPTGMTAEMVHWVLMTQKQMEKEK